MTVLWLAMPPEPVQAHPCDDLYSRRQDRETCWWHYWNSLAGQPQSVWKVRQYTAKLHRLHPGDPRIDPWDRRYPPPVRTVYVLVDERVCDSYYAHPDDRANCRWRLQNRMPVAPAG